MRILGIHDGHNASACLLEDGQLLYVLQEERLRNFKNYVGFPEQSVRRIFDLTKLTLNEVDYVAWASHFLGPPYDPRELPKIYLAEANRRGLRTRLKLVFFLRHHFPALFESQLRKGKERRLQQLLKFGVPREGQIHWVEHHTAHAATAYYGSPWRDDVLVLSMDGAGDGLSSTVNVGRGGTFQRIAQTEQHDSLGYIYSRATFLLGMTPLEHEYKVMGLAPYAPSKEAERSYGVFLSYLDLSADGLTFRRRVPEPLNLVYPRMRRDLALHRFDSVSGGVQRLLEDLLTRWVRNAVQKTGLRRVAVAGGVFMNVKANKAITELPEVDAFFAMPSCGDDSISIGAAWWLYAQKRREAGQDVDIPPLGPIYFGDEFEDEEVEAALAEDGFNARRVRDAEKTMVDLLLRGEVVARCSGRMEFGARALGNRSILADPSRPDVVRTINRAIKNRDFWMPFAPVVLKEREEDYLVNPKRVPSPYMMMTYDTTERVTEIIAAVHQADLTCRPQVIYEPWNPAYHRIVERFAAERDIAALLNTSFNLHGYPIVRGPREALWTFRNSGLRHLQLGRYLVSKDEDA